MSTLALDDLHLAKGNHHTREDGVCLMAARRLMMTTARGITITLILAGAGIGLTRPVIDGGTILSAVLMLTGLTLWIRNRPRPEKGTEMNPRFRLRRADGRFASASAASPLADAVAAEARDDLFSQDMTTIRGRRVVTQRLGAYARAWVAALGADGLSIETTLGGDRAATIRGDTG